MAWSFCAKPCPFLDKHWAQPRHRTMTKNSSNSLTLSIKKVSFQVNYDIPQMQFISDARVKRHHLYMLEIIKAQSEEILAIVSLLWWVVVVCTSTKLKWSRWKWAVLCCSSVRQQNQTSSSLCFILRNHQGKIDVKKYKLAALLALKKPLNENTLFIGLSDEILAIVFLLW